MQTGDGFIFYLDSPVEQPGSKETEVLGWVAALKPVEGICLVGREVTALALLPRPDVKAAFPGHPYIIGFKGLARSIDLKDGALRFGISIGGIRVPVAQLLPARPEGAKGLRRWRSLCVLTFARLRLRGRPSRDVRWNWGLRRFFARNDFERAGVLRRCEADQVLELFAETFPEASVLQIGANDGVSGDPLARWFAALPWRGILVEPVPHLARALTDRYSRNPRIAVEPSAISDSEGAVRLFRIAEDANAPAWYQQLASLDRSVLLKHRSGIADIESRIIEETVPAMTVSKLLERHRVERIDLLVVDTEGHDYQILKQFDFSRIKPLLIMFEHQHLSETDKNAAYKTLEGAGYRWFETAEGDTLAWRCAGLRPD